MSVAGRAWSRPRCLPWSLALGWALAATLRPAAAQSSEPALPGGSGEEPVTIEADRLSGRPDRETAAEGRVEFRRGPITIKAERLEYSKPTDTARAVGEVEVRREGNVFRGPELQIEVQRFRGWFREPSYFFERTQAGGSAERFDFLDEHRGIATGATYSSCPAPDPAWVLSTRRVTLDNEAQEGQAEAAVLR
ncbi:MAG TPA: LPS-assembly protein LptD, partial [Methylibium sp.]|nr:LPS-assembly protein LptD [Methylibium sp.]